MATSPTSEELAEVFSGLSTILDDMTLPAALERIDGTIRWTGHRISPFLILDDLFDGKSVDDLRRMYPTVSRRKFLEVIHFRDENPEVTSTYHREELAVPRKLEALYRPESLRILEAANARRGRILASRARPEM